MFFVSSLVSPVLLLFYFCRILLPPACQVASHGSSAIALPPSPPHRATVGQTSLVVSSVDFLEPLREAEELTSDNISVIDVEPWLCLIPAGSWSCRILYFYPCPLKCLMHTYLLLYWCTLQMNSFSVSIQRWRMFFFCGNMFGRASKKMLCVCRIKSPIE